MFRFQLTLVLILVGLLLGCSSHHSDPLVPSDTPTNPVLKLPEIDEQETNRTMLGIWTVDFDLESMEYSIAPRRDLQAHWNATSLIPAPTIQINSYDPNEEIIDIDVTIFNPYSLDVYDVRLIIFTDSVGHRLTNADDWTSLYDIPGGMIINPFKAYAKDQTNRIFAGQTQYTENLKIKLPNGNPNVNFAVDASYPGNCEEPYEIANFHQSFLNDDIDSVANLSVVVKDWQNDVLRVELHCPQITGLPLIPFSSDDGETWESEIMNESGLLTGKYIGFIRATSSNFHSLYEEVAIQINHLPAYKWSRTWGGNSKDAAYDVIYDETGYVYVTGFLSGGVNGYEIFLSKVDANGDTNWTKILEGSGEYEWGKTLAFDSQHNIYVVGVFSEMTDFDPSINTDIHVSNGYYDIFLTKFDPTGSFQWVRTWGGESYDTGIGLAIDEQDNSYITGMFNGTVDFDPDIEVVEVTSTGNEDIFVSKFDSYGNFQFVKTVGGLDQDQGWGITTDKSMKVYITGQFQGSVDFDPDETEDWHAAAYGKINIFLSKYDNSGNYEWTKTWGDDGYIYGHEVACDNFDFIYVTGDFLHGTIDFDPGPDVDNHTTINDSRDAFLSKFNTHGEYIWAKTWGSPERDICRAITIDSFNNVLIAGGFIGTSDFDPSQNVAEKTSCGSNDIFLTKFDGQGNFQWVQSWCGQNNDIGLGVAVDNQSNVYLTGYFHSTIDFDPSSGQDIRSSVGENDVFLLNLQDN
ncbi:hypothetical protein KKB99_05150 [bacterium]|nr:hypothetical protein [bacterium]MBU1025384.1 hypothetical protein [bacterium]